MSENGTFQTAQKQDFETVPAEGVEQPKKQIEKSGTPPFSFDAATIQLTYPYNPISMGM